MKNADNDQSAPASAAPGPSTGSDRSVERDSSEDPAASEGAEALDAITAEPSGPVTADLEKLESECVIEFLKAGGPGGQRRNKVETAVRLRHLPTGTVVTASDSRSQARNRKLALERLAERLHEADEARRRERKRRARKATRPSAAARRRRVEAKKKRGQLKRLRRRVKIPSED